ncbi:MAG: hypothetical protein RL021_2039, partial [Bacteroidota bacterium]
LFDFTKSTGPVVSVRRNCGPFERLELDDNVDILLHTDTAFYLQVTAGQNLVDGIITKVEGNTLRISNENRSNWVRSFKNRYTVEIGMDQPVGILYSGSGSVTCMDTISTEDFTFDCRNGSGSVQLLLDCQVSRLNLHTGRCDMSAKGKSGVTYLFQNDIGYLIADELMSGFCYVRNNGTGDIRLNVEKELGVDIFYYGNVYYRGNPYRIDRNITGSGKLIKE